MSTLKRHRTSDDGENTSSNNNNNSNFNGPVKNEYSCSTSTTKAPPPAPSLAAGEAKVPPAPPSLLNRLSKRAGIDVLTALRQRAVLSNDVLARADHANIVGRLVEDRHYLVDSLSRMAEDFRFHKSTAHVAVSLLDRILSCARIHRRDLNLLGLACMVLAAKFEERETAVPTIQEFLCYFERGFGKDTEDEELDAADVRDMIHSVLQGLDFRLFTVTALHFVEILIEIGYLFSMENGDQTPVWMSKAEADAIPRRLVKFSIFFADLALQRVRFQCLPSASLALVIVACARQAVGVYPICPEYLENALDAKLPSDVQVELWNLYYKNYVEQELAAATGAQMENATTKLNHAQPQQQGDTPIVAQKPSPTGVSEVVMKDTNSHVPSRKASQQ